MTSKVKIEYVSIEKLLPYAKNARAHSAKQIKQITKSIQQFNFINPVIIDENFQIIAGHGRVLAAEHIKLTQVPTIQVTHLTESEIRAYRLADNKLADNSNWDNELLKIELEYLTNIDIDIDVNLTGFETAEIDVLLNTPLEEDPEDPPPLLPEAEDIVTRQGDLWLCGPHKIICGDCRDENTLNTLMGKSKARIIITDPPYNVPIDGHVCGLGKIKHKDFAMASGEMTSPEFAHFLKQCFEKFVQFSTDGSLHFVFMDWRHLQELLTAGNDIYETFINLCIWVKTNAGMGSLYRSQHELIAIFKNGLAPHINNIELGKYGRYRTNVWSYPGVNSFGKERDETLAMHPTVKPIAMIADAIMDVTNHNDIVLDGFVGSGTTLLAAEQTNRRCYAIEIDPRYVDVALNRWMAATSKMPVHAKSNLPFTEIAEQRLTQKTCEA
ncbi:MAG TPA: DNA methylase N-4 [Thiotrichaceae bacterium]|jgi:DNA modification methylase|nr:DNA methylase N-4 [Thiotrichaceae bacterium]HIM07987.1 DNA methylase N-4 [Gammaproteobacteria bacterium]